MTLEMIFNNAEAKDISNILSAAAKSKKPNKIVRFGRKCSQEEWNIFAKNALDKNMPITVLDLSGCELETWAVSALIGFLKTNRTVTELDLSNNQFTYQEIGMILNALTENTKPIIQEVSKASQKISKAGKLQPATSIPLVSLNLSNSVKDPSKEADNDDRNSFLWQLSKFIEKNWTLGTLKLAGLKIGAADREDFYKAIKAHNDEGTTHTLQSAIKDLDLSGNKLPVDDLDILFSCRDISVDLRGNAIESVGHIPQALGVSYCLNDKLWEALV